MGTAVLGVKASDGLLTAAGFSYSEEGMTVVSLVLGMPGVNVGTAL